jgi:hypothetical protein
MAIIVVGGNARNVGKTALVTGLISHLVGYGWTALKITSHAHCGGPATRFQIVEEQQRSGCPDTARYLAAGAVRAWLVCAPEDTLAQGMPMVRSLLEEARNAIVESNRILEFIQPDLALAIMDPKTPDIKPSAQRFFQLADAVLFPGGAYEPFPGCLPRKGIPNFVVQAPSYLNDEVLSFVKQQLVSKENERQACSPAFTPVYGSHGQ